jgi:hypothetical protein
MNFNKCFFFSRSKPFIDSGGGGRRRTHQVLETLKPLGVFQFVSTVTTGKQTLQKINKQAAAGGEYGLWSEDRRNSLYRLRSIAKEWTKGLIDLSGCDLAVVEDPVYFKPLMIKLKRLGIPIIASCQNIESLSYGEISLSNQKKIFAEEIEILRMSDLAITISTEDSWLLNNFNIKTFYFPYFPPEQVCRRLSAIRAGRQNNKKENIILLGNAGNIATRKSMLKACDYWQRNNLSRQAGKLLTAGYKTDIYLKDIRSYKGIEFLGPLANEELDKKLAAVKACLCFQEEGGGALTRIGEMLLAGIPVLANSSAARSYYNKKGVIEFHDLQNLDKALEQTATITAPVPKPVEPDPAGLISEILKTSGKVV